METAENSILIERPLEETHRAWLDWVGQSPSGDAPGEVGEPVPDDQISSHDLQAQEGSIYFHDLGGGSTRATIQLTFDPRAQRDAEVDSDAMAASIDRYLRRFKHFAEA